jgi:response regulator NasT
MISYAAGKAPSELTTCLLKRGYEVLASELDRNDILSRVQSIKPQVLIMVLNALTDETLNIIQSVNSLRITAVVLALNEWDDLLAKRAMDAGVSGYILSPFEPINTGAILESSWHHFQKVVDLQETLEFRKLVEKAKGILMDDLFISEEDAHQKILKMSQDQSIPLKDVCQTILQRKKAPANERVHK